MAADTALAQIPPGASVAATPRLGAQLAARLVFYEFPREYLNVTERPHLKSPEGADWAIIDLAFNPPGSGLSIERMEELVVATFPPEHYRQMLRSGAVIVLEKR